LFKVHVQYFRISLRLFYIYILNLYVTKHTERQADHSKLLKCLLHLLFCVDLILPSVLFAYYKI